MKAVILAAGKGSRLRELTANRPKCMVHVNGRCIIRYQLDALLRNGVDEIHIVVGFHADLLETWVRRHYADDGRIRFVRNADYATTNNMYSLYCARGAVGGGGFLLMNADVVFDESVIARLCAAPGSGVCVDVGAYAEESMKVALRPGTPFIRTIAKTVPPADALGCSIDVYRFSAPDADRLFGQIGRTVEGCGERNAWTEVALDELAGRGELDLQAVDIQGADWWEIDNMDDLRQAEVRFGRRQLDWPRRRLAFVDMDGTLFRGGADIPGAAAFVSALKRRVEQVYVLSNNSSRSRAYYHGRLAAAGVPVDSADIVLSSDALAAFLVERNLSRVFLVGTGELAGILGEHGIRHDAENPEAVVLGYDTELTYAKLAGACLLLQDPGMPYFATHIDRVCPTERGPIPDIGSLAALIEAATGRRPDAAFGKPDMRMVRHLFERHGVAPHESVFVGDRVYTDYELAAACGGLFVGVLTGDSTRADLERCENIVIFPSVAEVFALED